MDGVRGLFSARARAGGKLCNAHMNSLRALALVIMISSASSVAHAQDFLDRVDEALTFSAFNDNVRARLSGTLDLELYFFQQPPPGLILTDDDYLFNYRLSLFFDAQLGPQFYFFIQSRIDTGFDPTDH